MPKFLLRHLTILLLVFVGLSSEAQRICVGSIQYSGNRITKESVMAREVRILAGDCYDTTLFTGLLEESKQNLMNTTLFNFVEVELSGDSLVDVIFRVTERWYLWASPIFIYEDRNFSSWLSRGDYSRLSYGAVMSHNNLFGKRQVVNLTMQGGYNRQVLLLFQHPRLDSSRRVGFELQGGIQKFHEAVYNTIDGREAFVNDPSKNLYQRKYALLGLRYRPGIHESIEFNIGIEDLKWDDTLLALNAQLTADEVAWSRFLKARLRIKIDHRNYASYPLKGWYSDVEVLKHGFGIEANAPDELQLNFTLRGYRPLARRTYLALGFQGRVSAAGPKPYYLNHALGYGRDYIRGYELYVIDGQRYSLFKSNLRYELLKPSAFKLPYLRNDWFSKSLLAAYINVHYDAGFVTDHNPTQGNYLANQWLYAYGAGVDLMTYYDLVFRMEYSVNHLGQGSFNIHFMAAI